MSLEELKCLIKSNNQHHLVTFLNKKNLKDIGYSEFCPNYEDYYILQDLLKKGRKSMAMVCIEAGFRLLAQNIGRGFDSLLHLAVVLGCQKIVQSLIDRQAPLNLKNCNQETPLVLAAMCRNNQIINMILSHVGWENFSNNEGFSHFHIACMQNRVDAVKKFLIFGADINQCIKEKSLYNPGFTALHFAVQACSFETVELLVNSGADMTIQDKGGLTPLHLAFRMKNKQMIHSLLSVQCYFASNPVDPTNLSHFHIACAMNNVEVVKDFVEKGIKVDHKIPYEAHHWSQYDALHFAITHDSVDVVKYIMTVDHLVVWSRISNTLDCAYVQKNEEIIQIVKSKVEKDIVMAECNDALVKSKYDEKKQLKLRLDHDKPNMDLKRLELSQYTELHLSVMQANQAQITSILKSYDHSIVLTQDARGKTPVHLAFDINQKKVLYLMLLCHLKLSDNPSDANGLSHFHISCTINNPTIVKDFIQKGVDINVQVKADSPTYARWTPLHFAIASESIEVVNLLLTNDADYTIKNCAGLSSFDVAIPTNTKFLFRNSSDGECEWELVEEILLEDENRKRENFNNRGVTLLHIASAVDDVKEVKRLASTDALNRVIDKDMKIWGGYTPLHLAAHYGNKEVMKILLDHKADTSIQSARKRTAADCVFDDSNVDKRLLLSSKNICNSDGMSQFHLACQMKNVTAVRHFLKLGVDVNKPISFNCGITDAGKTPLHFAVSRHDVEIVKLLLKNGADVHARDIYLNTPLHECGNLEVLKLLLERGADVYARNCDLMSALSSTIQWCKGADFITALFENGLDVNEKDRLGIRMFHLKSLDRASLFVIARHVRRLLALGIRLNKSTMDTFNDILGILSSLNNKDFEFGRKCREELESMKKLQVDDHTTLYDLLLKDDDEMVVHSNNETVKQIMRSEVDLKKNYPIYSYLLILQFKRGLERMSLMSEGKKSLNIILKLSNDCVLHHILQFFNNRELKYVNLAAEVLVKNSRDKNMQENNGI